MLIDNQDQRLIDSNKLYATSCCVRAKTFQCKPSKHCCMYEVHTYLQLPLVLSIHFIIICVMVLIIMCITIKCFLTLIRMEIKTKTKLMQRVYYNNNSVDTNQFFVV